jgi:phosphoribosyl 1,2-cyclic phosphodiesterase
VLKHAHGDHVRGAVACSREFKWKVYASRGTLKERPELKSINPRPFRAGERFCIGPFSIRTIPTPHNCAEPVALVVRDGRTGRRAGVCTDLGFATTSIRRALRQLDILILESNHDLELLEASGRPDSVKARIQGKNGHPSNVQAVELIESILGPRLRHVVLADVSESCNCRRRVRRPFSPRFDAQGFKGSLHIAHQHQVNGPYGLVS